MREDLLNHKYTKLEDRTELMVKEVTKPGLFLGDRGHITNNNSRLNYRSNNIRGIVRGDSRQNNRENYRNERYSSNNRDRSWTRERTLTRNYGNNRK